MECLGCISETKYHERKFPNAEDRCYCRFGDVCLGDGNLKIGLNQSIFKKKRTTRHVIIEGLHIGKGVPVGYGDGLHAAVVTTGGGGRTPTSCEQDAARTTKVSWSGE
jgi:hypothetical protein